MAPPAAPLPSERADKTIVEKRGRGQTQSGRAVKAARQGLEKHTTTRDAHAASFDHDMLTRHAKVQQQTFVMVVSLLAVATYTTHFGVDVMVLGGWLMGSAALAMLNQMYARRFLVLDREDTDRTKWLRIFTAFQFAGGVLWAGLFAHLPVLDNNGSFSILCFAGAIVVTAMSFIASRNLSLGVIASATPVLTVIVLQLMMVSSVPALGLAMLMIVSLAFYHFVGVLIRNGQLDALSSQAERDQLVMELEASRGISEEARRRAEEANLAKSRFLATMSHELRTPLNAILGFSEIMTNEVMGPIDNSHYKEYLADIHRSGAHLLKLINEILDLSRIEAGRYELNEEPVKLGHAVEESQQMVKLKASQKNVQLVIQLQPDMPPVWADARAVRQIVLNLLSNALKFTPSGGTIWLKCGWTSGGGQYITIRDTGPGIPEEEIPIVLSSFGQGSIAIKSAEQGTGLGLPIVQALMQMHEGRFDLRSKLRAGTEVTATFPRSRVMAHGQRQPARQQVENAPAMSA
ncbi:MAG: HAMP domain-containing sensor histidine kinase [Pseudomonadota bacterium]